MYTLSVPPTDDIDTPGTIESSSSSLITPIEKVHKCKPNIAIVLMGITGSGKSTFIKNITGIDVPVGDEDSINSTTFEFQEYQANIDGTEVFFIDTPGFDDDMRNESEILKTITNGLAGLYSPPQVAVKGVIYLHDITIEKFGGTAKRYLKMFQAIVGQDALKNVTLLSTKWDRLGLKFNEAKEKALIRGPWKDIISEGATVHRIGQDGLPNAWFNIVRELLQKIETPLQVQKELVDENMPLNKTTVGKIIDQDLKDFIVEIKKAMQEAGEDELKELRVKLEIADRSRKNLEDDFNKYKARQDDRQRQKELEFQETLKAEREVHKLELEQERERAEEESDRTIEAELEWQDAWAERDRLEAQYELEELRERTKKRDAEESRKLKEQETRYEKDATAMKAIIKELEEKLEAEKKRQREAASTGPPVSLELSLDNWGLFANRVV
ncbi:hypothetical protein ABW20_dc0109523 [Dactylellina cionopaga]|nr:hypothetical protein ABW20_dc0109523 [Dactylellina cionopaga]